MRALIDADIVAYRAAASAEAEPVEIAIARADKTMHDILARVKADRYSAFISGAKNFRKIVNPDYKANRPPTRPQHLEACKEFLIVDWKAQVTDGYEADDALGLEQDEDTVICTIDKDLKQVPGLHYQWEITGTSHGKQWTKPEKFQVVYPIDGIKFFWKQMLIGDTSDNILGVDRIGPKKADALIDPLTQLDDMLNVVLDKYEGNAWRLLLNGVCLHIWQKDQKLWPEVLRNNYRLTPQLEHEVDQMLESMKSMMDGTSMEPISMNLPIFGSPVNGDQTECTDTESPPLTS